MFVSPSIGLEVLSVGAEGGWGESETSSTGVGTLEREGLGFAITERALLVLGCTLELVDRAPRGGSVRRVAINKNNFLRPLSQKTRRRCRKQRGGRKARRREGEGRPRRDSNKLVVTVSSHEVVGTTCPSGT